MIRLLNYNYVLDIHKECLKLQGSELFGIRDANRLHSIINQQDQFLFNKELYPSIYDKAAMIWENISLSHMFIDGNKRVAFLSTIILLRLNGVIINVSDIDSVYNFSISIIVNHLSITQIKKYLISNTINKSFIVMSCEMVLEETLKDNDILKILYLLAQ